MESTGKSSGSRNLLPPPPQAQLTDIRESSRSFRLDPSIPSRTFIKNIMRRVFAPVWPLVLVVGVAMNMGGCPGGQVNSGSSGNASSSADSRKPESSSPNPVANQTESNPAEERFKIATPSADTNNPLKSGPIGSPLTKTASANSSSTEKKEKGATALLAGLSDIPINPVNDAGRMQVAESTPAILVKSETTAVDFASRRTNFYPSLARAIAQEMSEIAQGEVQGIAIEKSVNGFLLYIGRELPEELQKTLSNDLLYAKWLRYVQRDANEALHKNLRDYSKTDVASFMGGIAVGCLADALVDEWEAYAKEKDWGPVAVGLGSGFIREISVAYAAGMGFREGGYQGAIVHGGTEQLILSGSTMIDALVAAYQYSNEKIELEKLQERAALSDEFIRLSHAYRSESNLIARQRKFNDFSEFVRTRGHP